ncbi:UrcA family protein [Croceicoccus gelatinilyticus]|uniref:UrcA family protein n=1 Tax=Croceicoccus gelatinilyticus TaxID=2835536 RepID=UPI001BCCF606|nr:UrcA family protein [Croceicoccus gelatinilyticus]MBS7669788.1 UrcA family protein [Croceicoccus gelatinilyticus]
MKTILTATAALAMFAASGAASAKDVETASREVSFEDVDLTTAEGQEEMERRIVQAARKVCKADTPKSFFHHRSSSDCFEVAMKKGRIEMAKRTEDVRYGG